VRLRLAEQRRVQPPTEARLERAADAARDAALRERNGEATIGAVVRAVGCRLVCGKHEPLHAHLHQGRSAAAATVPWRR
jgi:hypothetical protein